MEEIIIKTKDKSFKVKLCDVGYSLREDVDDSLSTHNAKVIRNALQDYFRHRSTCDKCKVTE